MAARKLLVGNFLYFAREGDTIDSVLVSSSAKPDHSPTSNWTSIGDVEEATLAPKITEESVFSPLSAGGYGRSELFFKTAEFSIAAVIQDMSELFFELLTLSTPVSSHAIAPLAATGRLKGWFNLVQRDQAGTQISTIEVYGLAKVNAVKFGNGHAKGTLEIEVLNNALNTGTLSI